MINDRVRPQSQSYTSARRLGFRALGLAAFAVVACAAGAANAQGNLKIGVINVGKLLESAPQSKVVSDIHCVTQWSRYDNRWTGVSARALHTSS